MINFNLSETGKTVFFLQKLKQDIFIQGSPSISLHIDDVTFSIIMKYTFSMKIEN